MKLISCAIDRTAKYDQTINDLYFMDVLSHTFHTLIFMANVIIFLWSPPWNNSLSRELFLIYIIIYSRFLKRWISEINLNLLISQSLINHWITTLHISIGMCFSMTNYIYLPCDSRVYIRWCERVSERRTHSWGDDTTQMNNYEWQKIVYVWQLRISTEEINDIFWNANPQRKYLIDGSD